MRRSHFRPVAAMVLLGSALLAPPAIAKDPLHINVVIKNHAFTPAEIHVPVGQRVILIVANEDATPEEFDSSALKVEKVIVGGTYATIWLRPLGPGRYPFMGEFHPGTAQGVVISG